MITPNRLYQLVQSLDKNEKGYFKKYAAIHSKDGSNYLSLFEIFDGGKEPGKKELKYLLKKEGIPHKHYAPLKNYLYHLILKSLRSYHNNATKSLQIKSISQEIEILYSKGLYQHCEDLAIKGKKIAMEFDYQAEWMILNFWHIRVLYAQNKMETINKLVENENATLNALRSFNSLTYINQELYTIHFDERMSRSDIQSSMINKIMDNEVIKNPPAGFHNQIAYEQAMDMYKFLTGNQTNKHLINIYNLFKNFPALIKENPSRYISTLINLLVRKASSNDFSGFNEIAEQIEKNVGQLKNHQFQITTNFFLITNRLYYMNFLGEFNNGVNYIKFHKKEINEIEEGLDENQKSQLFYIMAYVHFGNENYSDSLSLINHSLSSWEKLGFGDEVARRAMLLRLLIFYEREDLETLSYFMKSYYRFLLKKDYPFKIEKLLLQVIRKLLKTKSPDEIKPIFKDAHAGLTELKNDPLEKEAFRYFHYVEWLESKISGKSFANVVKGSSR